MLLFKKKFLDAIRRGEKTQTVRLWVRPRLKSGQRSFIPGAGYIWVQSVTPVELSELTDEDALPDGFPTADALRAEISAIYSQYPDRGQQAYRIKFALAPGERKKEAEPSPRKPRASLPPQREARKSTPAAEARRRGDVPSQAMPSMTAGASTRLLLPAAGFLLPQRRSN